MAKMPSPLPAENSIAVGVESVMVTVMTASPADASSSTLPVCPSRMMISVASVTVTV